MLLFVDNLMDTAEIVEASLSSPEEEHLQYADFEEAQEEAIPCHSRGESNVNQ
jgi:hypothetical protein